MNNPAASPKWNTTSLWGVLLGFLIVGTAGGATFVYGILGVAAGNLWYLLVATAGGTMAFLAFLFIAGILYRVDRYRGANQRRVELFE